MKPSGSHSAASPRFVLAVFAVVALNLACAIGHGFFTRTAVLLALLALGAALAACVRRADRPVRVPRRLGSVALAVVACVLVSWCCLVGTGRQHWSRLFLVPGLLVLLAGAARGRLRVPSAPVAVLATAALLLSGKAVVQTGVLANAPDAALAVVRAAAGVGFLLIAALVAWDLGSPGGRGAGFRLRLALLFASGAVLRVGAVVAWPEPSIDVFVWLTDAPHALLLGHNPYAARHMSLGELAAYPPLPVVMTAPFAAVGLDVRYANVVCDLLGALLIFLTARRAGRPLVGALGAGIYLHLPGVPFVLSFAWYEPMLAALLGGGVYLTARGFRIGNLLLGLALTGKQYGLPLLVPLWCARRGQRRALLVGVTLAAVLVVFPFFLWSPRDFLNVVLHLHLAIGPDVQSLTVRSALYQMLGFTLPGWFALGATLALTAWVSRQVPVKESGTGLWVGTTLLVFSLFFVKGYFNYFYLCNYLFVLGIVAMNPEGEAAPAALRETPPAPDTEYRAA